jgi:hypothetical protein
MLKNKFLRVILVLVFLFSSFLFPSKSNIFALGGKYVLVYENRPEAVDSYIKSGFDVIEIYESFFFANITQEQEQILVEKNVPYTELKDVGIIRYAGYTFTSDGAKNMIYPKEVESKLGTYPKETYSIFLLQFIGPIKEEWKYELEGMDVKFYFSVPSFAYLVKIKGNALSPIKEKRFVRTAGYIPPILKVSTDLLNNLKEFMDINIVATKELDFDKFVSSIGVSKENASISIIGEYSFLIVKKLPASKLANAYNNPDVLAINKVEPAKIFNAEAAQVVTIRDGSDNNNVNGLEGEGEVVAVGDTGLCNGDLTTLHPGFPSAKIIATHFYPEVAGNTDWADNSTTHGTHVSGTILGTGAGDTAYPSGRYKGMAPQAGLVMQSLKYPGIPNAVAPPAYSTLFGDAYSDGARIHSDSWGGGPVGGYSSEPQLIDTYLWENKDFIAVFAAGNNAPNITTQGTAKNIVTAGAVQNNKSGYNPLIVPSFSCRGPIHDSRIKPDVVAPGQYLRSTYKDGGYVNMSGTSMSTPVTAGALAIIREYYRKKAIPAVANPPAALLKATLINGCFNDGLMDYTGTNLYIGNYISGWGRVDVSQAIYPEEGKLKFYNETTGLLTGNKKEYYLNAYTDFAPVKATLVWTDYPGTPKQANDTTKDLVNDLDLKIIGPGNVEYHGNRFRSNTNYSMANPVGYDDVNNVEVINIEKPTIGQYKIEVIGKNISVGPQPFALVVSGTVVESEPPPPPTPPGIELRVTPGARTVIKGQQASYTAKVISKGGASGMVNIGLVFNIPGGSPSSIGITYTINPNPVSLPAGGSAEAVILMNTSQITPNGNYNITVNAASAQYLSNSVDIFLNVIEEPYFDISFAPAVASIRQGESITYNINILPRFGFSQDVEFVLDQVLGMPQNSTFKIFPNPTSQRLAYKSQITINTTEDTPVGDYEISIMAKNIDPLGLRDLTVIKSFKLEVRLRPKIYKVDVFMKSFPEVVQEGDEVKYRIQIRNIGNEPLVNNTIIFELDPNLEFLFSEPAGNFSDGRLYISAYNMNAGDCYPGRDCNLIDWKGLSDQDTDYLIIKARVKRFTIPPKEGQLIVSKLTFQSDPYYTGTFAVETTLRGRVGGEYPIYFKVYLVNLDPDGTIPKGKELIVKFKIDGGTGRYLYSWDWNDGEVIRDYEATTSEITLKHTYNKTGTYRIRIDVKDSKGRYKKGEIVVKVK